MTASERFIVAMYYGLAGIVLGFAIALHASLYLSLNLSSAKIVMLSIFCCFCLGYVFPKSAEAVFKSLWAWFRS